MAWCNKVNGKVHATTNEFPFERLKAERLNPLRRIQKDCLISYAGNQYSVPAEYIGKDVAVVALDSLLAACYEGKHLDHIFAKEAKCKRRRAYEKQIQMSGFPIKKTLEEFDFSFQPSIDKRQIDELATMRFLENGENVVFLGPPGVGKTHLASVLGIVAAKHRFSTYYVNCQQLIEQLKKAHFENRLPDRLKILSKYRMLIIDEIGYLPMDIQGTNLFFQLIARRYEKVSTVFTSNKTFSQWNEVFADVTIASAILDRVLHHCTVVNIKGESYRLKERKEFMRQKQQIVNTLFEQGNA